MTETLHGTLRWPLLVFQIFGFMPVMGTFLRDASSLKFSWYNFRTFYALASWFGATFLLAVQILRFQLFELNMDEIHRFWYYLKCSWGNFLFVLLAKNWPSLMHKWSHIEKRMRRYGQVSGPKRTANVITGSFLILFLIDYILMQLNRFHDEIGRGNVGFNLKTWNYLVEFRMFAHIYEIVPYNFFSGIILMILQLQILLCGTFIDLLIVILSLHLAAREAQLTDRIKSIATETIQARIWQQLREDYNKLELYCKYLNSRIGCLVMASFVGNLGVVLLKLFDCIKTHKTLVGYVYLGIVIVFMLFKIFCVCIVGATVNEESRRLLKELSMIQSDTHNVEVERLTRQISRDIMAISGVGVFYIRRNIVLKIAGSIVTYELIFIQFVVNFLSKSDSVERFLENLKTQELLLSRKTFFSARMPLILQANDA